MQNWDYANHYKGEGLLPKWFFLSPYIFILPIDGSYLISYLFTSLLYIFLTKKNVPW